MNRVRVSKIRPITWRISVQGEAEAEYVRQLLEKNGIATTTPQQELGLTEPPVWSFQLTSTDQAPLTTEELEAILEHDERVELFFES